MARPSSVIQQRNLSLTEELERLEQSITLTLQEIDHNFSKAHRIVTSSILPIVEQYASHSRDVWEGSKFWKQFFESSANVSLSGYEEQSSQQEQTESITAEESDVNTNTSLEETSDSYDTPSAQHISTSSIQDIDLSNLTISPSHSTPRPNRNQAQPTFADYPSPYEALRQEVNNTTNLGATSISDTSQAYPSTPGRKNVTAQDVAITPGSSPLLPRHPTPSTATRPSTQRKKSADPLLHRILDKTYRIQATPLSKATASQRHPRSITTPATANRTMRNPLLDSTLSSSPEVAPPQLHAEIFNSPERKKETVRQQQRQQRTPGVSVLTPARNNANKIPPHVQTNPGWDSDDDEDGFDEVTGVPYGASPPKTMQFHIPQSRLLKTPAREASKRIVEDILETAGVGRGGPDDTDELDDIDIDIDIDVDFDEDVIGDAGEHSPSIIRRAPGLEDETF